jgi:hypothetical protein
VTHSSRRSRTTSRVSESLDKRLNLYSLAASAAGLSVLAFASPAEAKIVYTPVHVTLKTGNSVLVDLNNDGINDFNVSNFYSGITHVSGIAIFPYNNAGNRMLKGPKGCSKFKPGPAPLKAGAMIGKARKFAASATCMAVVPGHSTTSRAHVGSYGSWRGVHNGYLGVQFQIKGQTHFGWLRFSVSRAPFVATLTGYAYETVPNKSIIAGRTKGAEDIGSSTQSASLGALALGAPGLLMWRKKELAEAVRQREERAPGRVKA